MTTKEPTHKLVVDVPASVMDALLKHKDSTGVTVKQLVLDAIGQTYGYYPVGVSPSEPAPRARPAASPPPQQTARPVPKPGRK